MIGFESKEIQCTLPGASYGSVSLSDYSVLSEEINGVHGEHFKKAIDILKMSPEVAANELAIHRSAGFLHLSDEALNSILENSGQRLVERPTEKTYRKGGNLTSLAAPVGTPIRKFEKTIKVENNGEIIVNLSSLTMWYLLQGVIRKTRNELITMLTPSYVELRSGIKSRWRSGLLIDAVSGEKILGGGINPRPLKFNDGISSTNMLNPISDPDGPIGSHKLAPAIVGNYILSKERRSGRSLLDPYGVSAPSIRSVAAKLVAEINLMSDEELYLWGAYIIAGAGEEIKSFHSITAEWIKKSQSSQFLLTGDFDEDCDPDDPGYRRFFDNLYDLHDLAMSQLAKIKGVDTLTARATPEGTTVNEGWKNLVHLITCYPYEHLNAPYSIDDFIEMKRRTAGN